MTIQTQDKEFEDARNNARNFGGTVYVGGVVAATALFIAFVLTAFPSNAYLSRTIMTVAGAAVGASMLAFPYALHNWAIEKNHRKTTIWLYYIEMIFIGVNTVVSFVNLLARVTNFAAPEWAILYEPFSVCSIIYVIFAWGTIFLTDPQSLIKQQEREYVENFKSGVAQTKLEYLKSPEGRRDVAAAAQEEIRAAAESRQMKPFFSEPINNNHKEPVKTDPSFRQPS